MEIYLSDQLAACLAFAVLAFLGGLVYDLMRTLRGLMVSPQASGRVKIIFGRVIDVIFDLLYMLFLGVAFSVLAYCYSYGKLRGFDLISFTVFFLIYRQTLGRLYHVTVPPAVGAVKFFVILSVRLLTKPFTFIFRQVVFFIQWVYSITVGKLILKVRKAKDKARFDRFLTSLESDVRF